MRHVFPRRLSQTIAIIVTAYFCTTGLPAQQRNDSLLATFQSIGDDSIRLDSMFGIAFELGYSEPFLAIWLCEQAEADPAYPNVQPIVKIQGCNTRGAIYYYLEIDDLALSYFLQALRISDSISYDLGVANASNNIGNIQEQHGQYEAALVSYRKARSIALRMGEKRSAVRTLANIAQVYQGLKDYDKAIEICDSALHEIEDPNDSKTYGLVYSFMGNIYRDKEDYRQALHYTDLSVKNYTAAKEEASEISALLDRAHLENILGQREAALKDATLAMQMAREFGAKITLMGCYDELALIAKGMEDPNLALQWMEKSKTLSDSIHTEESQTALANYQALYEVNQKDSEIDLLSKDKEIQEARLTNVWYLFGLVSVVLLAMVSVVVILVRSNKARSRINQELQGKNEQLNNLNHEMSGILHVVAHDLKAPLNQVTGLLSVVEEEGNLNAKQEKMLGLAKKVTNNAGNLVKDLVELGSAEQQAAHLQKVPVPLKSLVAEVAAAFSAEAARKSIVLETALPADEVICQTEPNQLRRVLENLISNALKFSPSGKNVQISLTQDAGYHRISIQDQGPGISPADQKNLYRKFHKLSARPTGGESSSGLGLAIVKTLVEQLGGDISLDSQVGVGSTFVVRIPG